MHVVVTPVIVSRAPNFFVIQFGWIDAKRRETRRDFCASCTANIASKYEHLFNRRRFVFAHGSIPRTVPAIGDADEPEE